MHGLQAPVHLPAIVEKQGVTQILMSRRAPRSMQEGSASMRSVISALAAIAPNPPFMMKGTYPLAGRAST